MAMIFVEGRMVQNISFRTKKNIYFAKLDNNKDEGNGTVLPIGKRPRTMRL